MPLMLRADDKAKQIADSLVGFQYPKDAKSNKKKKYQKQLEFEEARKV